MDNILVINNKEDNSVEKAIQATANKLKKKYTKKRKIRGRVLKEKTLFQRIFSGITSVICCLLAFFCLVFCISSINSSLQKVVPSFAGYSTVKIVSGSMINSGYNIGDIVVVKAVDTNTLKSGDIIAFYTYSKSYYGVSKNDMELVPTETIPKTKNNFKLASFFGIQNKKMQEAGKANAMLVFHHIRAVYEDNNGERWFSTYGSSNATDDAWLINESYVVGISNDSSIGVFYSKLISLITSPFVKLFLLLIPLFVIGFFVFKQCIHEVQLAKLELDIVEEKRKLTDPICVKNEVGFSMDKKTKYKVLAQAKSEDINLYLSLLWRDGSTPENIRKHYLRKKILLSSNTKLRNLNRECEEMFTQGKDLKYIAKYYDENKKIIKKEYEEKNKRIKTLLEKYRKINLKKKMRENVNDNKKETNA